MANEEAVFSAMADEELEQVRLKLDADIDQLRAIRKAATAEHNRRLMAAQIKARYGEAGAALLAVMSPEEAKAALDKQKSAGQQVESGTVVPVSGVAGSEIGVAPLSG